MRKYWTIATMYLQIHATYRLNTLLESSGYFLTMLIAISLWLFAFHHNEQAMIGDYTRTEMITYLLIAGIITTTLWYTAQGDRIMILIRTGGFSRYLVKPVHVSWYHFIAVITGKLTTAVFSIISAAIIFLLFDIPANLPLHLSNLGFFVLFIIFAVVIQFLIFYTAALLAFWMEEVWGIAFTIRVLADVAAGTFIPLSLFAPFWQNIFDVLPFKYIVSVPVNVLMGRMEGGELFYTLAGALAWLVVLFLLSHLMLKRGIRHYSAVGG